MAQEDPYLEYATLGDGKRIGARPSTNGMVVIHLPKDVASSISKQHLDSGSGEVWWPLSPEAASLIANCAKVDR